MPMGRTQLEELPVITLALAEARSRVGATPNIRAKKTGSGDPMPLPRSTATLMHSPVVAGAPGGQVSPNVNVPGATVSPQIVCCSATTRAAASAADRSSGFAARETIPARAAGIDGVLRLPARHPQRA